MKKRLEEVFAKAGYFWDDGFDHAEIEAEALEILLTSGLRYEFSEEMGYGLTVFNAPRGGSTFTSGYKYKAEAILRCLWLAIPSIDESFYQD